MSHPGAYPFLNILPDDTHTFLDCGAESVTSMTSETDGMAESEGEFPLPTEGDFYASTEYSDSIIFDSSSYLSMGFQETIPDAGPVIPSDPNLQSGYPTPPYCANPHTDGLSVIYPTPEIPHPYFPTSNAIYYNAHSRSIGVEQAPSFDTESKSARVQKGYRKSTVAQDIPTQEGWRLFQDNSLQKIEEEEEDEDSKKTKKKSSTKQRRTTVKNQQMSISDQTTRLASPPARTPPYIRGICNDSRHVHIKKSSKTSTPEPYILEVALPNYAEQVSLNYLIIPKPTAPADREYFLQWHNHDHLREFKGSIPLVWPKRSRRSPQGGSAGSGCGAEEAEENQCGTTDSLLVLMRYHLDLPGSSASIAYLRLTYSIPYGAARRTCALFTEPFVVFTQLQQRLKGVGYFIHLFFDLDIRSSSFQVTASSLLEATNRLLLEGINASNVTRQITMPDIRRLLQDDSISELSSLTYPEFKRVISSLCPIFYALRCKTRHPNIKQLWYEGEPVDRVTAAMADSEVPDNADGAQSDTTSD